MTNKLPFIGWLLSLVASISVSIPFWLIWTHWGFGAIYFYWLPPTYLSIPFWHCVGLFILMSILRGLVPSIASVSQSVDNKEEKKKN